MWPGPRYSSVPSGILLHPAVWPQQTWAENWGLCPFREWDLVPILHNVARAETYLRAKFHLDPSSRLGTIDTAENLGGLCRFFKEVELRPHLTQCRLGRGLSSYHVAF